MKKSAPLLVIALLAGCATTRTVTEKQPMTGQFSKYTSVRIEYQPSEVEEAVSYYNQFAATFKKDLDKGHFFQTVTTEKGATAQLVANCLIAKVDKPSEAMTLLTKGKQNSKVTVEVTFHEAQNNRSLASIEVTGDSAMHPRTSIGRFSMTSASDLTTAALEEAAAAVTGYVKTNMTESTQTAKQ